MWRLKNLINYLFGSFLGSSKMPISIFGLQLLTSKCTPAWPCRDDFDWNSSFCKLYDLEMLELMPILVEVHTFILHSHAGVWFDVKGWSPIIEKFIFEDLKKSPKIQRVSFCKIANYFPRVDYFMEWIVFYHRYLMIWGAQKSEKLGI